MNAQSVYDLYGLSLASMEALGNLKYVAIIAAVAHDCFLNLMIILGQSLVQKWNSFRRKGCYT